MSRVAVTILTNESRREILEECIQSFLDNCRYRPLDFYILDNGSTDDTREYLSSLEDGYGLSWNVESLDKDIGCAAGTNKVSDMARGHEYVLHLESDFIHIDESKSGFNKMWLRDVIGFMDEGRCDYLYLRKIKNEWEMSQHWWSQWMGKINTFGKYMHCPGFWWSNNPHIRKNEVVYKSGVLPLDESKDGPKGTTEWSKPELEAGRPGLTWIMKWGVFLHESAEIGSTECCQADGNCKYGFSVSDKKFCEACDLSRGIEDMGEHEGRYSCAIR